MKRWSAIALTGMVLIALFAATAAAGATASGDAARAALCSEGGDLSEYHLQAAIAAVHAGANDAGSTDWQTILGLYDQLAALNPSPVVALNRVVALAKARGAEAGLAALEALLNDPALRNYYLLPAVRGRLLVEVGEREGAAACFRQALSLPCSEPERRFLRRKLAKCDARG